MNKEVQMMYVYDIKMKEYLVDNGQKWVCSALALSNQRQFWQFLVTDEFSELLKKYKKAA